MSRLTSLSSGTPSAARPSRRTVLRYGTATLAGGAAAAAIPPRGARAATSIDGRPSSERLVPNYLPRQPTGWEPQGLVSGPEGPGVGRTVGGHIAAKEFSHGGVPHVISLLPFGQEGEAPDPVYIGAPDDREVAFRETLEQAFGETYAFTYTGGLTGRAAFTVESYSVFARPPSEHLPVLVYGMNLYLVYHPDPADHGSTTQRHLQFIQVVRSPVRPRGYSEVDNAGRANPFFPWGGRTSVYGRAVLNFSDTPQAAREATDDRPISERFTAETFLVSDTGKQDRRGRGIAHVLGGVRHGWQVQESRP